MHVIFKLQLFNNFILSNCIDESMSLRAESEFGIKN